MYAFIRPRSTIRAQCASTASVSVHLRQVALLLAAASLWGCTALPEVLAPSTTGAPGASEDAAAEDAALQPAVAPVYGSFEKDTLYKLLVAEVAGRRGRLDLSTQHYLEVADATGDAGVAERGTRIALYAQDEKASLAAAALWADLASTSPDALGVHGALLLRDGKTDQALVRFRQLVALETDEPRRAYARITDILGREKNRESAIAVMDALVASRPGDLDAQFALAELATRTGNVERAVEQLQAIRVAAPDDERSADFLARVLQSQGQTGEAVNVLSEYLARRPEAHGARMSYGRLLVGEKRYDEARDQFALLSEAMPDNADARFAYAIVLLQVDDPDGAKAQFEELVRSGKRDESANYYLGQIAENQGDRDAAISAYRRVDRGEFRLNAQMRVAVLLADNGDLDAARAQLQGLRRHYPNEAVRLYRAEADLLVRAEDLDGAITLYGQGLKEFPKNTDLQYARAMVAARANRVSDLERDLRDILVREPDNADALNALGYTLADQTDRYQEAHALIAKAVELKPEDHYIIDSLGWVLYRLGRLDEAAVQLRRAYELRPDAEIAAHLGEVLWKLGDREGARTVWRDALKESPDDKKLLDVIRRLDAD